MELTHGFFPSRLNSVGSGGLGIGWIALDIGRNRFLMQLSLKYEILDTRQEATSLATILFGPRYPTSSTLQCGLPVMSAITH